MAEYFEFNSVFTKDILPHTLGYTIIPLYGKDKTEYDYKNIIFEWIDENISGQWSTFTFGIPSDGQGYCFLNENDAMAFKLRWA